MDYVEEDSMIDKIQWCIFKFLCGEWIDDVCEVMVFWGEFNVWEEGFKINVMMVMVNYLDFGKAYNIWGKYLLVINIVLLCVCELIILCIVWLVQLEYEWYNYVGYVLNFGMSFEEIVVIKLGYDGWQWEGEDCVVFKSVDELVKINDLFDEIWVELGVFYDKCQMMDFVYFIGYYVMIGWVINVMCMLLEDYVDLIGWDFKIVLGKMLMLILKFGEFDDWVEKCGYED